MGIIFGLALIVGSICRRFCPSEAAQTALAVPQWVTQDVTDHLVHSRETSRTMQQQIDDHLQQAAEWLVSFQPSGDTHEHRKAYLMRQRDVTELVTKLSQVRDSISQSNLCRLSDKLVFWQDNPMVLVFVFRIQTFTKPLLMASRKSLQATSSSMSF